MEALINNLRQWLKTPKVDNAPGDSGDVRPKREKHWYNKEKGDQVCIFCEGKHWGDACEVINTIEARRQFFQEKKLCFNCGRAGHWGKQCRSRGCFKCKSKHHTSLCDKDKNRPPGDNRTVLTSYSPSADEWLLPAIIPVKIKGGRQGRFPVSFHPTRKRGATSICKGAIRCRSQSFHFRTHSEIPH